MTQPDPAGQVDVREDAERQRYVAEIDGHRVGLVTYTRTGDVVTLVHTEVDDAYGGRGVGSRLVGATLDDLRTRSLRVEPRCPFVRAYVEKHPEYADLVAGQERGPST